LAYKLLQGDVFDCIQDIESSTVQCCVTSPPYYGLRDYGQTGQIGLEETSDEYIAKLVTVFRGVRRVLKDDGTLWIVIGDCYAGSRKGGATHPENAGHYKQGTNRGMIGKPAVTNVGWGDCKPKDLVGIPWMLAFALRADGWYLRQDIIYEKSNAMPESVKDRCTRSHEYIFLLTKQARYYYNSEAIKEPANPKSNLNWERRGMSKDLLPPGQIYSQHRLKRSGSKDRKIVDGKILSEGFTRNKRSVWTVATSSFSGPHFATFPPELIEPCILAGSKPGDLIFDPFAGSGTTLYVAEQLGRDSIGIELSPQYCNLIRKRLDYIQHKIVWDARL